MQGWLTVWPYKKGRFQTVVVFIIGKRNLKNEGSDTRFFPMRFSDAGAPAVR